MERIIIAANGSAEAQSAVDVGLELAHVLGARVTFVAARKEPKSLASSHTPRLLSDELRETRAALAGPMAAAQALGVDADFEIVEGPVAQEIVRAAAYRDADLIVAGADTGGPSSELVEISPLPVLVVKQPRPRRARRPVERRSGSEAHLREVS